MKVNIPDRDVKITTSALLSCNEDVATGLLVSEMVEAVLASKIESARAEFTVAAWADESLPDIIIVADTLVEDPDDPHLALGKPQSRGDAAAMLVRLSGRSHNVWSGTAILSSDGEDWQVFTAVERAAVEFSELGAETILGLLDSGSWLGKAGGYDLAGEMGEFASLVAGERVTVLGFAPLAIGEVRRFISKRND